MIGDRLKTLRKNLKLSQADLGERLGVNPSALSQMENGHIKPSLDTLTRLSALYGANLHWLITGNGSMYEVIGDSEGSTERRLQKIRKFLSDELNSLVKTKEDTETGSSLEMRVVGEIAAGVPAESIDTSMDIVNIRRSLIHGVVDNYICLRVNGHSMEPMVYHNDVVVIRQSQDWEKLTGHICALRIDGAITLKRLTWDKRNKLMVLLSVNEEYQPILIKPEEHQDISLIGTLHYLFRKL